MMRQPLELGPDGFMFKLSPANTSSSTKLGANVLDEGRIVKFYPGKDGYYTFEFVKSGKYVGTCKTNNTIIVHWAVNGFQKKVDEEEGFLSNKEMLDALANADFNLGEHTLALIIVTALSYTEDKLRVELTQSNFSGKL